MIFVRPFFVTIYFLVADCVVAFFSMNYLFGMCLNSAGGVWDLGIADANKAVGGVIPYVPIVQQGWYQVHTS